jgi:hypothetical protein
MKKIYLYLCGGLGNQLFQYAAAKNLSLKNEAKIILDIGSSYNIINHITTCVREKKFKPILKFSLQKNKLKNTEFKKYIFFFLIYRIFKKIFIFKRLFYNFYTSTLINEMILKSFEGKIKDFKIKNKLYLFGYFQSENYFYDNKKKIIEELMPTTPKDIKFLNVQKRVNIENAICVGLRFYEELNDNLKNKIGGLTNFDFYKIAITKLIKNIKSPEFFIFSTKKKNVEKLLLAFNEINKYKINIITEDEGYKGDMNNLWLMSMFKNYIISNSSLYWWAAYFSQNRFENCKIICSGNFANKDTCLDKWKLSNFL